MCSSKRFKESSKRWRSGSSKAFKYAFRLYSNEHFHAISILNGILEVSTWSLREGGSNWGRKYASSFTFGAEFPSIPKEDLEEILAPAVLSLPPPLSSLERDIPDGTQPEGSFHSYDCPFIQEMLAVLFKILTIYRYSAH